jgi:predicted MFS family arabinose efflux permease
MLEGPLLGLFALCASSFLIFLSYTAIQNLESSIRKGAGTTAVGVIYLSIICATPFAPRVISALGRKWALIGSMCTYVAFVASNLSPSYQVMLPAAVVIGVGGSVYWPTVLSMLKHFSVQHAKRKGLDESKALDLFSSAFWGSFQFSQLIGSLMIYLLFQNTKGSGGTGGVETLLPLVCTICAALGCLLGFVMLENTDEAENKGPSLNAALQLDEEKNTKEPGLGLKAALKLITSPQSLLLCGVYLYNGLEQGFAWCNFTSGMVLPVYGNEAMIGILMMCYAATDALTGSLSSQLSSSGTMTRSLIFYAIVSQSVCVSVVNNFFNNLEAPLYVTAFVLGVGDALLNTKIGVLLGSDFKGKEHVVMVSLWRVRRQTEKKIY